MFERSLEVLAGTPPVLRGVITDLLRDVDARPAEGAWSAAEVLAHLLHSETVGIARRVRALSVENNLVFEPTPPTPPPGETATMLEAWTTARMHNLEWLRLLTPEQRQHVLHHPRFGAISVATYVAEWAFHDLDHIRQILATQSAELYPHIGTFQELYAPPA